MPYRYEYKVESVDYMGVYSYGEFVSPVKLNDLDAEMAIVYSNGYAEIMQELHDLVDDISGRYTETDGEYVEYGFTMSVQAPIEIE